MTNAEQQKYLEAAKALYETDEVQVDPDAKFSESDDGVWVQAWVFVPETQ